VLQEATISGHTSSTSAGQILQLLNQIPSGVTGLAVCLTTLDITSRSRLNLAHYPRMHLPQPSAGTRHRYACDARAASSSSSRVIDRDICRWSRHCSSLQSVPGQSNRLCGIPQEVAVEEGWSRAKPMRLISPRMRSRSAVVI